MTSIEAATNGGLYELVRSSDEVIARIRARGNGVLAGSSAVLVATPLPPGGSGGWIDVSMRSSEG